MLLYRLMAMQANSGKIHDQRSMLLKVRDMPAAYTLNHSYWGKFSPGSHVSTCSSFSRQQPAQAARLSHLAAQDKHLQLCPYSS